MSFHRVHVCMFCVWDRLVQATSFLWNLSLEKLITISKLIIVKILHSRCINTDVQIYNLVGVNVKTAQ